MKILLLVITLFLLSPAMAQFIEVQRDSGSTVTVHKDPRFDELSAKQAEINKRSQRFGPRRVSGFRIQAANTQNRDEANAVKAELLRRFPDEKTYLLYQQPSFRVRIGNFLTQRDAFTMRKMISALYPGKGIYIVPDTIEYTAPGEEEDQD
ncbi:MAG TPA: SPOR domain-containing protein [Segetibacter sp.]